MLYRIKLGILFFLNFSRGRIEAPRCAPSPLLVDPNPGGEARIVTTYTKTFLATLVQNVKGRFYHLSWILFPSKVKTL